VGSHSSTEIGWGFIAGQRYVGSHSWTEIGFLAGQRYAGSHSWAEICGISQLYGDTLGCHSWKEMYGISYLGRDTLHLHTQTQ